MRHCWLLVMLCGGLAWAQAKPAGKSGKTSTAPTAASDVSPDAPVLTIKGLCASTKATSSVSQPCQTVVTREQFEKLVLAIQPSLDQHTKQQIGRAYPDFLIMANEAQQSGLDKTSRFEERLAFARLQILSQELVRQIQLQAADVPDKDIEDYYQNNAHDFLTADLQRIVVPLHAESEKTTPESLKKEAETLRASAAAGEDFSKLQKAAYTFAGVSGNTEPDPNLRNMRRRSLPMTQASAFDLHPGEVSPVITDGTGHYIYKMVSKGTAPLESVKKEIWNTLRQERSKKMIENVQKPFTTEVNHAYFGTEVPEDKD